MVARQLRAMLASALVLVSLASILPLPPVGAALPASESLVSAAGRRENRGATSASIYNREQVENLPISDPPLRRTSFSGSELTSGSNRSKEAGDSNPAQNDSGSQKKNKSPRWEPPPFDRPPLRSGSSTDAKSSDRNSPATRDSSQSTGNATERPRSSGREDSQVTQEPIDPDAPAGRSDRPPPVLRRSEDSRSQPGGSTRPPVLHRPSDPQDEPSDRSSDGRSNRGTPASNEGDDDTVRLEASLINIPLVVSDRSGRFIPQLIARDFTLYEDGVRQEISSFANEEVPFNVALMLDVSPSVSSSLEDIQNAAIEFVRQLRPQDRVMVISFDRRIHYLTDMTNDRRALESAIRLSTTGSGTSVYDAVYEVVSRRLRGVEGRKALILFSDGEDTTSSHASYDDAISIVTEADVLVYGLRYPSSDGRPSINNPWPRRNPIPQIPFPLPWPWPFPRRRRGPFTFNSINTQPSVTSTSTAAAGQRRGGDFMSDLAAAGGGPVYDAERIGDLSRLAAKIADELRHVYVISYYPSNPLSKGGYRSIRVRVNSRDDLAVRHRRGYNATQSGH